MDKSIIEKARTASHALKWSEAELKDMRLLANDESVDSGGVYAVRKMTAFKNRSQSAIKTVFSRLRREQQ